MRVVAVIDGEHHPPVARDALEHLAREHEVCAVLFAGGEEKVGVKVLDDTVSHYGREVLVPRGSTEDALAEVAASSGAEAVMDLSGEPVLDGAARFRLASVALHLGLEYRSPGLELTPPALEPLAYEVPALAVIGTGKRTGKTAVSSHYAMLLRKLEADPVVVSMGRGGPPEPQLIRADEHPDLGRLLEIARAGGHAASDYLEDAVLAGVTCIGCRRCGEGPAGETFETNVSEVVRVALDLDPGVLLLEGSGAALPPVEAHRAVCVTSAHTNDALSYLGPYRLLRSDLVVIVGADQITTGRLQELKRALGDWSPQAAVVGCSLEPEPAHPVREGARVAAFTTASSRHEAQLRERLANRGLEVRVVSSALARRVQLERDLERARRERCDVYLTELKAAAIEVVAEAAESQGAEVVFLRNRPASLPGELDLDAELERLFREAQALVGSEQKAAASGGTR